jgi:tetratricopeptide (TPR) repeat protein
MMAEATSAAGWGARIRPLLGVLAGAALIASVRAPLYEAYRAQAPGEHQSWLLSPERTVALSLGYREALADYVFANTLVAYGLSFQEKRRFELAGRYLDTINALSPKFRAPYLIADTLLTLQTLPARTEDLLKAREVLERGMRELPYDAEVWLVAGQYMAYLAAPHVPAELYSEFRLEGARILSRACELASNNANIPYHCIAAAGILDKAGQREAVIQMLSRTLAVNDDETIRKQALALLEKALGEREREQFARRTDALNALWQSELPLASRNLLSVLGPGPDVFRCAGRAAFSSAGCHTSWITWARELESAAGRTRKSQSESGADDAVSGRGVPALSGDFPGVVQ